KKGMQAPGHVRLLPERERRRHGYGVRPPEPLRGVGERDLLAHLLDGPDRLPRQFHPPGPSPHVSSSVRGASTRPSIFPKTLNTRFTASMRSVVLPLSSSEISRVPTPASSP